LITEYTSGRQVEAAAGTPPRDYLGGLKALNMKVTNWIKSHVEENPLVDLSPVFRDYRKHLKELKATEVEPVTEEDAFYSRKCKLFYKKEVGVFWRCSAVSAVTAQVQCSAVQCSAV
jgi:hypothetical protein